MDKGILGLWGFAHDDIWACGESSEKLFTVGSSSTENVFISKGVILEYNGNTGHFLDLPDLSITFGWIKKDRFDSYFLTDLRVGNVIVPDSNKIFLYNSNGLKELLSSVGISTVNVMN